MVADNFHQKVIQVMKKKERKRVEDFQNFVDVESLLLWSTKVSCLFLVVSPRVNMLAKTQSLKMSKLLCLKEEVIRFSGK